jgi:polysaccharide deacetylase 2 family uncharacterized protein YibQ
VSRKGKKRPQKKKVPRTKKTKKGMPRDIWQAMLLTGTLIAVSAIISIVVFKAGSMPTPNAALPVETVPPLEVSFSEPIAPEATSPVGVSPSKMVIPETTIIETAVLVPSVPQEMPTPQGIPVISTPQAALKSRGTLVFVIDDAGNNLQELEPFLRFPGPLTIAVLPGLPHSAEAARRIRAAGKDIFLHQPMEALGGQAPGPGAIYAGMDTAEILAVLKQNIVEIGPVTGMNNHQGSKITEDQLIMETVLTFCRDQKIHFLDSRTTTQTVVPAAAKNLGIKIGERNIFIDNDPDRISMNRSIQDGLVLAAQKGNAVMIGHVQSPELAPLLMELYQGLIDQGYTLSTASGLIIQDTSTK